LTPFPLLIWVDLYSLSKYYTHNAKILVLKYTTVIHRIIRGWSVGVNIDVCYMLSIILRTILRYKR